MGLCHGFVLVLIWNEATMTLVKCLVTQAREPEFNPQDPHKEPQTDTVRRVSNTDTEEAETGRAWAHWPALRKDF